MKIAVLYWSGTGNTKMMAEAIKEGLDSTSSEVSIFNVSDFDLSLINQYDRFALGCPSMGAEVLEENEFEPFYSAIEPHLSSKSVLLFGSYGWGDGQWMRDWVDRALTMGIDLLAEEGFILNETPDQEGLDQCYLLGHRLGS